MANRLASLLGTVVTAALLTFSYPVCAQIEAPTGFDDTSIEPTSDPEDKEAFDKTEVIAPDGLGPVYNAQACRECHQNPTSGGASQVVELRAGHIGKRGQFIFPNVPIVGDVIRGRTLINDRAICENAQERVPVAPDRTRTITTNRLSLNLFGDGFVEAADDTQILARRNFQCDPTRTTPPGTSRVCGVAQFVEVLEAAGQVNERLGRFGWKNQHASLLSFASDAYLNEMGITNRLTAPVGTPPQLEITMVCNPPVASTKSDTTVTEPNDQPENGIEDIDRFARFMRSRKAPPRFTVVGSSADLAQGEQIFKNVGCELCHAQTLTTVPSGTMLNGGTFKVTAALGNKTFHPFSDFLLHDVGTGDGIALSPIEHFGPSVAEALFKRDVEKLSAFINAQVQGGTSNRAQDISQVERRLLSERVLESIDEVHEMQTKGGPTGETNLRLPEPSNQLEERTLLTEMRHRDECDPRRQAQHVNTPADQIFYQTILCATHRLRTPPLWGLHQRSRLMHDGNSLTIQHAIERHREEAEDVTQRFRNLSRQDKDKLLLFLGSL
jgi:CxxC motif-containing protein (DUF1111 family)